ncbi:MAG: YCII-related protein [Bacteroidetes bacterium]|nr:YCII-related protein [Bacteroidota bacterium]
MYVLILKYLAPIEKIDALIPAHRKFLDKYYLLNKFICSGAQVPRTGGIILCNAADKEEARHIIAEDPFYINHAAKYDIIEFVPSKYAPDFESFVV